MKNLGLTIISLLLISICSYSQIFHIPADHSTIQEGINAATHGDTVLVAEGTYYENLNFMGKGILLGSTFILDNDPSKIESTIINGSTPIEPDTASCVLFINGEDSNSIICGFTITGGMGTLWDDEHNPGYYYTEGGGILIQAASPTIKNNIIRNNEAINRTGSIVSAGGGAIRCGDGNPTIQNNIILENEGRYGGGIVLNFSGATISNNIIAYNSGGEDYGGGGIWAVGEGISPKSIVNNTIVMNQSATTGGGIRLWSTEADVKNNIFWGNTAFQYPQIQGGGSNLSYCNVEGGYAGTGNIDEDPAFAGINYLLDESSPCIDAGVEDAMYNDPEDPGNPGFALFPAMGAPRNDMGVYGGPLSMGFPAVITFLRENNNPVSDMLIFPNPCTNEEVSLKFTLSTRQSIQVALHSSYGKNIRSLHIDMMTSGNHSLQFDVSDLPSGVYFVKVIAGTSLQVKKLILIR